jgi:hypothetical protein
LTEGVRASAGNKQAAPRWRIAEVKRTLLPLCIALALTGCRGATAASTVPALPVAADASVALRQSANAGLLVTPTRVVAAETTAILGANMATWYDITQAGLAGPMQAVGMKSLRWPGGSESDNYHWKTQSLGPGNCSGGYAYPPSTLDALESDIANPSKMDVAITVNYGSNATCDGGGDPAEAAAWVTYANNTKHYNITWWTVGNEEFGSWETDLHSQPHNGAQYASEVATTFYPQMKAASSTPIKVGVDVEPGYYGGWDQSVLSQAKYDFVELHYYPQGNTVSDSFIIDKGAAGLTQTIDSLKKEMQAAGHADTPIYVGEIGSTYGTPGKQTTSITQALYAGQVIGEMAKDGVARATWWLGYGGCNSSTQGGDFDASLYGWQDFGGYMMFSDGTQQESCSSTNVPTGTILPTARAYQVASHFLRNGEHVVASKLTGLPNVRAYAGTYDGGVALMLFNVDENAAVTVPVTIAKHASGKGGFTWTYDKSLYDKSKNNVWAAPVRKKLAAWTKSFDVTLPPWSMVVVQTK